MKAIFAALISIRGLSGLVGALLLATLIWLFAPALLGTESLVVRILLTAVPIVLWLVVLVVVVMLRQRRDAALVSGATETAERSAKADAATLAAAEEERVIGQRLTEALGAMKSAAGAKGGFLYERPWYVIIGPPGSGKTTAIQNSGLDFPLVAGRVAGVGGTRNCDWWIAEQAVLIDTAGRYTTQDSDARRRQGGLGALPRPPAPRASPPAAQRRHRGVRRGHAEPPRCGRARDARARRAPAHERTGAEARAAPAGLFRREQGRPRRRLHRILRRPRPGGAQPGLGHDLPG